MLMMTPTKISECFIELFLHNHLQLALRLLLFRRSEAAELLASPENAGMLYLNLTLHGVISVMINMFATRT